MKQFIVFLMALLMFMSIKGYAQVKPAQAQYLKEKGAFVNPGFEQGYKGWTITGCTKSLEEDISTFGKSLKLVCTAETFSVKQEITALAGSNLDLFAGCKVKSSAAGAKVRTLANAVGNPETAITGTDYNKFEESLSADATSNGLEVYADAAFTGTVYIEDCRVGLSPDAFNTSVTVNAGDMIYNNGSGDTNLAPGTEDQVLKMNASNLPVWASLLTGIGNLLGFDGTNLVEMVACANGEFVVWDDTEAIGFKCSSSLTGTLNPVTDMVNKGPITIHATTTNPTKASPTVDSIYTKRVGDELLVRVEYKSSGAGGSNGVGDYLILIPDGLQIDLSKVTPYTTVEGRGGFEAPNKVGDVEMTFSKGNHAEGSVVVYDANYVRFTGMSDGDDDVTVSGSMGYWSHQWFALGAAGTPLTVTATFRVPIVGWTSGSDAAVTQNGEAYFSAKDIDNSIIMPQSTNVTVKYLTETTNTHPGSYNPATGIYTFPVDGIYECSNTIELTTGLPTGVIQDQGRFFDGLSTDAIVMTVSTPQEALNRVSSSHGRKESTRVKAVAGNTIAYSFWYDGNANGVKATTSTTQNTFSCVKIQTDPVIAGLFENINDTDLVSVVAVGNAGQNIIPPAAMPFAEIKDTYNAWDGDEFTVPVGHAGRYTFSGSFIVSGNQTGMWAIAYVDTGSGYVQDKTCGMRSVSQDISKIECILDLEEGDKVKLVPTISVLLLNIASFHHLVIEESPDLSAIVKNLYENTTKCQVKLLTASISANNSDTADLRFTNITIGKKYKYTWNFRMHPGVGDQFDVFLNQGSQSIASVLANGSESRQGDMYFTATSTTLQTGVNGLTTATIWGVVNQSWARLCEYPDSYVDTNQW